MEDAPFRGSEAVAAGRVTPGRLRGPGYRSLFAGIVVPADADVDYALRCRAGALAVGGRGVLGGCSAAELLGASCALPGAPVELVVARSSTPSREGLVVRADVLLSDEIMTVDGVRVTTPARTAFDLGRRLPVVEAVVGVDALRRRCGVVPEGVLAVAAAHRRARGVRRLPAVLARSTALSDSPMETRIRVAIEDGGLPMPELQHRVGPYLLDLSYPQLLLAIEYDGQERKPERVLRDLRRQAYLSRRGWVVERLVAWEVFIPGGSSFGCGKPSRVKFRHSGQQETDAQRPFSASASSPRRRRSRNPGMPLMACRMSWSWSSSWCTSGPTRSSVARMGMMSDTR